MAVNPIEVSYQLSRTVYCIRIAMTAIASPTIYNTLTQVYEAYDVTKWSHYAIALTEVLPGYYRAVCPTNSLGTPATEIFFDQQGGSPASTDAPPIANGNSQGVNIATINGVISNIGENPSAIVDICNLALTHLGQAKIVTLSDNTRSAKLCNQIFNNNRDEVLRGASWKFATVLLALTELPDEDVVGWGYVYTFPTDCVYLRKVFADDSFDFDFPTFPNPVPFSTPITNPEGIDFRVVYQPDLSATVVVTNINPAYAEYTARIADPTLYDSLFIKALSLKLAAELSPGLNGDTTQRKELWQAYGIAMSEAAKANGNEDGTPNRKKSGYVDVR